MSTLKVSTIQDITNSNSAMSIDSSGRVTLPQVPCFQAKATGGAYSSTSPVIFDDEEIDRGGVYNHTTGVFTAPIDGLYVINVQFYIRCDNGEDAYPRLQKSTNGGTSWSNISYAYNYPTGITQHHVTLTINQILDLDADDQLRVQFNGTGEYYKGSQETFFMGYLLG